MEGGIEERRRKTVRKMEKREGGMRGRKKGEELEGRRDYY